MLLFSILISLVVSILIITQDTNAIYEYLHPILPKFDYKEHKEDFTYLEYLDTFHNNFFTRLLTCPYCLGLWLSIGAGFFYYWITIPVIYVGSLIIYFTIKRLSNG
jgi:hypothetical protein